MSKNFKNGQILFTGFDRHMSSNIFVTIDRGSYHFLSGARRETNNFRISVNSDISDEVFMVNPSLYNRTHIEISECSQQSRFIINLPLKPKRFSTICISYQHEIVLTKPIS